MSDIYKLSRLHMLFIATALILSQFIILGCCDSDMSAANINPNLISEANSLMPTAGSIASVGSIDKYSVASFGNGPMGLATDLETGLTLGEDGSILKSRNLAMLSYGSELMNINDFSSLTGRDTLGNEFGAQSEKTVTLKNCIYPFALIKEDLTRISSDGTGIGDAQSKTLLLLPDAYSADDLAMFTTAFGDSGVFDVKMFKYTFDINGFFNDAGLFDLKAAGFNSTGAFGQLSAVINADVKIMQDMIREKQAEDEAAKKDAPYDYNQWDSNGGVSCNWAEIAVVK